MQPVIRRRGRGAALSAGLMIALTVFGVLLMHSVTPAASMSTSMSAAMSEDQTAMASTTAAVDSSVQVARSKHDCPSVHQMMHPCVGTTVSWPALIVPTMSGEIDLSPASTAWLGKRVDSTHERAPPWTLCELDKSVTLRV